MNEARKDKPEKAEALPARLAEERSDPPPSPVEGEGMVRKTRFGKPDRRCKVETEIRETISVRIARGLLPILDRWVVEVNRDAAAQGISKRSDIVTRGSLLTKLVEERLEQRARSVQ